MLGPPASDPGRRADILGRMTGKRQHRPAPRSGWVVSAIVAAIFLPALVITRGSCTDYVAAPGTCITQPPLGVVGSAIAACVLLAFIAYAMYRAFRRRA